MWRASPCPCYRLGSEAARVASRLPAANRARASSARFRRQGLTRRTYSLSVQSIRPAQPSLGSFRL